MQGQNEDGSDHVLKTFRLNDSEPVRVEIPVPPSVDAIAPSEGIEDEKKAASAKAVWELLKGYVPTGSDIHGFLSFESANGGLGSCGIDLKYGSAVRVRNPDVPLFYVGDSGEDSYLVYLQRRGGLLAFTDDLPFLSTDIYGYAHYTPTSVVSAFDRMDLLVGAGICHQVDAYIDVPNPVEAWSSDFDYGLGDVVTYRTGSRNRTYECIVGRSSGQRPDLNPGSWTEVPRRSATAGLLRLFSTENTALVSLVSSLVPPSPAVAQSTLYVLSRSKGPMPAGMSVSESGDVASIVSTDGTVRTSSSVKFWMPSAATPAAKLPVYFYFSDVPIPGTTNDAVIATRAAVPGEPFVTPSGVLALTGSRVFWESGALIVGRSNPMEQGTYHGQWNKAYRQRECTFVGVNADQINATYDQGVTRATAVGNASAVGVDSVAVGARARAGNYATAIGCQATADAYGAVAIGRGALAVNGCIAFKVGYKHIQMTAEQFATMCSAYGATVSTDNT